MSENIAMSRNHSPAIAMQSSRPMMAPLHRVAFACAAALFVVSLGLYSWTLAPTVTLVDSGELILAAHSLGVAHPPGFPLYVLLAHVASLAPVGSMAQRVNFASALFAALAVAVICLAAFEAFRTGWEAGAGAAASKTRKRKGPAKPGVQSDPGRAIPGRWELALPALFAGLMSCTSRTLWAYATVAEVYSLNTLLIALVLLFMLRWRRLMLTGRAEAAMPDGASSRVRRRDRWLHAAAITFGLALGVHHVTVGLILPACAALVLLTEGAKFFSGRRLWIAAGWACAGLGIYVHLPLAAARSPLMNWGDPRTFDRFLAHVTGWQYRVYFEARPELMMRQLADFASRLLHEFGPAWFPAALILAIIGSVCIYRRARPLFWFLCIGVAANLAYNMNYEIAEDKDAYYLPVFLFLILAAACGVRQLPALLRMKSRRGFRLDHVAAVVLLLAVPGAAAVSNYAWNNRRNYYIAQDYVQNMLSTVAPGGMLLTLDWQVYSPMLYLQEIENLRKDAIVIDINHLRRSWYFPYLERTYPETMHRLRAQVQSFLEDLRLWEQDPELYQRDATLNRRISARFQDLILTLIAGHARSAPVYVTQEIATYGVEGADRGWVEEMVGNYQLVPQGLVFQLFGDREFHEPAHPALVTRGLVDGTLRFAPDDVVTLKVLPVYAGMSYNRGRYLSTHGRHQDAAEAYREALKFDPGFVPARRALAGAYQ